MKLYEYDTGSYVREATEEEHAASDAAAEADGGVGVILVEIGGRSVRCYTLP